MEMMNSMIPANSNRELQAWAAIIWMEARLYIQSGAVITRSNITCCCIHVTAETEKEYKSEFEYTKYTHISPVSFVRILEKIDSIVTA